MCVCVCVYVCDFPLCCCSCRTKVDRKATHLYSLTYSLANAHTTYTHTQVYQVATEERGLPSTQHIPTLVEQDSWLYHTTRGDGDEKEETLGRAMVCCVFVCSMWKAAGVFGEVGLCVCVRMCVCVFVHVDMSFAFYSPFSCSLLSVSLSHIHTYIHAHTHTHTPRPATASTAANSPMPTT